MNDQFIAKATTTIKVSVSQVWEALTSPEIIKQYMFGTQVVSDWKVGSPIIWKGIWKDKPYEDKGQILKYDPEKLLQVSHFSPLSGVPDMPENYHVLTYQLLGDENQTEITLSQDNNTSADEQKHSQEMWKSMLESLKKVLEK